MRGIGSVWGPGMGKHIQNTGDLLSAGEDLRAICEDKESQTPCDGPALRRFRRERERPHRCL